MSPVAHYSQMETVEGAMPSVDQYNRIAKIANTRRVITKTAAYTCLVEESGAVFIANHADTQVEFTLPTIATAISGVWYEFYNLGAAGMKITADPADTIVADNNASADSITFETADHIIGGACMMVTDGALWYSFAAKNLSAVPTINDAA